MTPQSSKRWSPSTPSSAKVKPLRDCRSTRQNVGSCRVSTNGASRYYWSTCSIITTGFSRCKAALICNIRTHRLCLGSSSGQQRGIACRTPTSSWTRRRSRWNSVTRELDLSWSRLLLTVQGSWRYESKHLTCILGMDLTLCLSLCFVFKIIQTALQKNPKHLKCWN